MKARQLLVSLLIVSLASLVVWLSWPAAPVRPTSVASLPAKVELPVNAPVRPAAASSGLREAGGNPTNGPSAADMLALPFRFATGPANARDIIEARIKSFLSDESYQSVDKPWLVRLAANNFTALKIGPVLEIYNMGPDMKLENARGGDYYYPLESTDTLDGWAELYHDAESDTYRTFLCSAFPLQISNNPIVLAKALDQLMNLDQVRSGSYEVRFLNVWEDSGIAASYVIWLKSSDDKSDLFYECGRITAYLMKKNTVYTREQFLKLLPPPAPTPISANPQA